MVICLDDIESYEEIEISNSYDLTVEDNSNYFIDCGSDYYLVHNSGKTYSSLYFIIYLCANVIEKGTINIIKETYNSFKTTLYDDFNRILPDFGIYSPFADKKEVDTFKILGTKINLLGADKPSKFHGASCDYMYINEALDVSKEIFDQAEMRCRKFWWMDYNPKYTDHWIYESVINRDDVGFLKTTFRDNPFISKAEKNKILSYDPNNPENIKQGTADEYMWNVYGLGNRAAQEGVIYPNVEYISQWPQDVGYCYGLDFGFTNDETALVKIGVYHDSIFFELLCYQPTENADILSDYMEKMGVSRLIPIKADSSDKYTGENKGTVEMVRDLREKGWEISKVSKKKSNVYWIERIKSKKLYCVENHLTKHVKKEQMGYVWMKVNGISINQPADKFNHVWDALKYGYISISLENDNFW